jgi:nitrogen-specific signal transduction histidine kinase
MSTLQPIYLPSRPLSWRDRRYGPGIPHKIRDRLYEPFVTAGKQDGLGLGLALSRRTVLNHGGDIWTEPASGARFVIRLPMNRARSSQNAYMLAESSTAGDVSKK